MVDDRDARSVAAEPEHLLGERVGPSRLELLRVEEAWTPGITTRSSGALPARSSTPRPGPVRQPRDAAVDVERLLERRLLLVEVVADDPARDRAEPLAGAGDVQLRRGADPHLAVRADHDLEPELARERAPTRTARSSPELLPT